MRKEIPEEHQAFIDALLSTKGNVSKATEIAGYSLQYGYALVRKYREAIITAAEEVLALHATRASFILIDGMEGDLPLGANTQIEAAKQVLDRIGIVKKDKLEVETKGGGIFILPAKND